jgi:hypothetical protein
MNNEEYTFSDLQLRGLLERHSEENYESTDAPRDRLSRAAGEIQHDEEEVPAIRRISQGVRQVNPCLDPLSELRSETLGRA